MIRITDTLFISEEEITEEFVRSPGPGGQNVNKVATAVQLRFDAVGSPSLPEDVRARLLCLAGRRLTTAGILVITARRFRSQEANRKDALDRLVALLRKAAVKPRERVPTRPTVASRERRLIGKKARGETKKARRNVPAGED